MNPTPPDCVATASPPGPGNVRANDALRTPAGPSAMTPCEFGPTSRTLWARASASRSRPAAVWPGPESPDDTTTAAPTPACAGVRHHVHHLVGRHDHDDQVDGVRHRGDRRVRRHTGHLVAFGVRLRVHDAEPAVVPARPDRVEDRAAQTAAVTAYADHGDAGGRQQRPQRAGLRAPLAPVGGVQRRGRHVGAQLDGDLAVRRAPRDREAGPAEHAEHAVVVAQHLGLEPGQAVRATQGGEVLEQQDAEPASVVLVGHQERHLGALAVHDLGRGQPGNPAADHRDHRGRVGVGLVEEVLDVAPGGVAAGGEEAQPQGVLGDAGVEVEERPGGPRVAGYG